MPISYLPEEDGEYLIGKGCVMLGDAADASSFREVGNSPSFNLNITVEKVEHYSSKSGLKVKDADIVTLLEANGTLELDRAHIRNLADFFMSEEPDEITQGASTGETKTIAAASDRWVPLGTSLQPIYNVTNVVVENVGQTITYVEGTDYDVDLTLGQIKAKGTGAITDGDDLVITYDVSALSFERVKTATASKIEKHFRFFGDPPAGLKLDVYGFASLQPNGDYNFISDEIATYTFDVEFLLRAQQYNSVCDIYNRGKVSA